jgi:hypothetical protein
MHALEEELVAHVLPDLTMRDISAWNGIPDIPSLGSQIIAVKATEGTGYRSPVFQRDWHNVEIAGKARMAYHFFHPSVSAMSQARFFVDTVNNAGLKSGDCLCIDHESTDGLNAAEVSDAAVAFRGFVEHETNCKLVVYTFDNFAKSGNCAGLGNSPLWFANPSHLPIPLPWHDWTFQQTGVTKGIDDDVCNFKSLEAFYAMAVLPKPPPLGPNQRLVKLTDGKLSTSTLINTADFVTGFKLSSGDAVFEVIEDGLVKPIANINPEQAAALLNPQN